MKTRFLLLAAAALSTLIGCNPSGTCVSEKEWGDLGAQCTINMHKNACANMEATTFFAEESAAGVLRCKGSGYSDPPGAARATDPKALHIYYRKGGATK
ncbi:MAG: hypothetical protein ABI193_07065 [Minicystis sp.]